MNISQPHESKTIKCPTCLQNRRHVAPLTHTFHKPEFIKREKFKQIIKWFMHPPPESGFPNIAPVAASSAFARSCS